MSSTDFKMTTKKKIIKKKIIKKKTKIVKKKKVIIKDKFDDINSTNINNKTEEKVSKEFEKFDYINSKKINKENEMTSMTEQQKQTEISRRVKNYWLREKKNKLVCLIGIGQTLKDANDERAKDDVGDMKNIASLISKFRPNLLPELAGMWKKTAVTNGTHTGLLRPSKIIKKRIRGWIKKNENKIKKKIMKSISLTTHINFDNTIHARISSNSLELKNPCEKQFKKCSIIYDKDLNTTTNENINYFKVLDWKSSVFSTIKYWKHFSRGTKTSHNNRQRWNTPNHYIYARLYEGQVNKMTRLSHGTSINRHLGRWFNPNEYASNYSEACIQNVSADKINDETAWLGAMKKLTDGALIVNRRFKPDGSLTLNKDFLPHIEITHRWKKKSKWSALKWKTVSNYNLIPKMCASLNIPITTFKKLYMAMLKDLKSRTFISDPSKYKEKTLWAILYNRWSAGCGYKKVIYSIEKKELYLSNTENNNLHQFKPAASTSNYHTQKLNLTFKNEVAGKVYEVDWTELIVMALMIGSEGTYEEGARRSSYEEGTLYKYARNWVGVDKEKVSSYIINKQLYPELCCLNATDSKGKIHAYY